MVMELSGRADEHDKNRNSVAYLQAIPQFYYGISDPIPEGQPIRFYLTWTNVGDSPALNPYPSGRVYVLPIDAISSNGPAIQAATISEWKPEYEKRFRNNLSREIAPIFPAKSNSHLIEGPVLTRTDRDDIFKNGSKIIFLIAAVRFRDANGYHEAHCFKYLSSLNPATNTARFDDGADYVAQIDLPNLRP